MPGTHDAQVLRGLAARAADIAALPVPAEQSPIHSMLEQLPDIGASRSQPAPRHRHSSSPVGTLACTRISAVAVGSDA